MSSDSEEKILKLYSYLKDEKKTQEIGSKILKSMIIDMLRSKLGYAAERRAVPWGDVWVRYDWLKVGEPTVDVVQQEVRKTLSEIVAEIELTEEELRIARELGVLKNEED